MDGLSISALVISGITAIGGIVAGLHIRKMNSGCCQCDCSPGTPLSRTPTVSKSTVVLQPAPVQVLNTPQSNGQETKTGTADC